jgi:squalene-hopene/tetraprenyl-beta-curcumene cyclase
MLPAPRDPDATRPAPDFVTSRIMSVRPIRRLPAPLVRFGLLLALAAAPAALRADAYPEPKAPSPQYRHGDIMVPEFVADEPVRAAWSAEAAEHFLDRGALAWARSKSCVSCHTTGTYLAIRPALSATLGRPRDEIRDVFVEQLRARQGTPREQFGKGTRSGEVVYIAAGLAEWDRWVSGRLSAETAEALELMFAIQLEAGDWYNPGCWPPLESDGFHLATQAAMAVAAVPAWEASASPPAQAGLAKLREFLRTTPPPHDYGGTLLLWAAARMPDLLPADRRQRLAERIWSQQQPDGGWSIRSFAAPEAWGDGSRAERLRSEPDFARPPSDGHQTGLAIVVLRESGVPATDPRLQRGLAWLERNQRESGRWWTRSLNTDRGHFVTYSGTAYPLLALALSERVNGTAAVQETGRGRTLALSESAAGR